MMYRCEGHEHTSSLRHVSSDTAILESYFNLTQKVMLTLESRPGLDKVAAIPYPTLLENVLKAQLRKFNLEFGLFQSL